MLTLSNTLLILQRKLELKFPTLKFKVDKKADSKYKPVSAASVVAKVVRDYVLKNWEFSEDIKIKSEEGWGSGYPGGDYFSYYDHPVFKTAVSILK